ncbi:MAG: aspartate/glutamate racemase family protein [Rhizomicrobium sp.]
MKTIGLLGGMSWESTVTYYQLINRAVQARLGGVHSARLLLHSFDFGELAPLQQAGEWDEANRRMADAARHLAQAGADFLIMCCNTMHCATPQIEAATAIPFLHIADPLGAAIRDAGFTRVGLLGSNHTMEQDGILRGRLKTRYGIDVVLPEGAEAAEVSRVIYEELVRGKFLDSSRATYRDVIAGLVARGAQAVILGCTELPLLVRPEDASVLLFDTTALHAAAAVEFALR